ncbi:MAG: class I SAM-dependent RNA methyltransferase [Candidatus Hydrogenedentes bacterium]|nr:class I SAM-dependent RNA methyltransferase [Candidatus Hydrogenedentota bacterium]
MATLEITSLAHGGYGVGRVDGQVWFVAYGLPGDRVNVTETRRSKGVVWGRIEAIESPSPLRTAPMCPVFGTCGACTWLHFAYPAQLEWKERIVLDTLKRLGGVVPQEFARVEDADLRLGYRTRAEFHGDGWRRGFYAEGSHDIVDITQCPLCHPKLNEALARLREASVPGTVEVTINPEGEDVLFWTAKPNRRLSKVFPEAQSFASDDERSTFFFDGAPVVNGTFSQSSLLLNRTLRKQVHDALAGAGSVLDLFCGTGNFTLGLDAEVVGVDHNRASVGAAQAIGTHDYRVGSTADINRAIGEKSWDAIVLDPPRTGARDIVQRLAECGAGNIVYVSCDPATLARDAKALVTSGWTMQRAAIVDMFPHTAHIETVGVFARV